jgi:hypothetical protein
MRVVPILATFLLVIGLTACGAGGGGGPSDLGGVPTTIVVPTTVGAKVSPAPATPATVLPDYASLVARSKVAKLPIYKAPGDAQPENSGDAVPAADAKRPQVFLVESRRNDGWVQVLLPVIPPGTTGWVRASDVTITQVAFRLRVARGAGVLTVFRRGREIEHGPILVDATAGKQPTGHFYLRAAVIAKASHTTDSPYVYGLTARLAAQVPLGTPVDVVP